MLEDIKPIQPEGGLTMLTAMRMCMYEEMVKIHGHKLTEFAIEDISDAIEHLGGFPNPIAMQLSNLISESNKLPDEVEE